MFGRALSRAPKGLVLCWRARFYHTPVMAKECLDYLVIKQGGVYIDCTLGGGGHSHAILSAGGRVIGIDQDTDAIAQASKVCKDYLDSGDMEIFHTNFRQINDILCSRKSKILKEIGDEGVDGVLMDLGISSHQIDEAPRGFAFGRDGPLDMRMWQHDNTSILEATELGMTASSLDTAATQTFDALKPRYRRLTAADIVNTWTASDIADVLYNFGDETNSRAIAKQIVLNRPLMTTFDLEKVISSVTSFKRQSATLARCFQALRIVVNDEMNALDEALQSMHGCLRPGGRLVILSYHSLEDRRVKILMKNKKLWDPLFKRGLQPSQQEVEGNNRARSAKLRVAIAITSAQ